MEMHQTKSKHEDSNQSQHSETSQPADEPMQTKKITDLNDDCLMKTFVDFDLQNLLNVAIVSKWLQPAAAEMYRRKFGGKQVIIYGCNDIHPNMRNAYIKPKEYDDYIICFGLRTSLLYLRCFGPSISYLLIDCNKSYSKRYEYLLQYINKYCAASNIKIWSMPDIATEQEFQNVYVENVEAIDCDLSFVVAKCFPNLRQLKLDCVRIPDRFTGKLFPHLEHLTIEYIHCNGFTPVEFAAGLLNGIHQLKSFVIKFHGFPSGSGLSISELLDLIKDKPLITTVVAWSNIDEQVYSPEVKQIVDEHSALVELDLPCYRFGIADAIALIRPLKSLQKITFQMQQTDYLDFVPQLKGKWKAARKRFSYLYSGYGLVKLD